jgi:hypothetical protein
MRRVVFLIVTLGTTMFWLGAADVANAICHHCLGRSGGCAECGGVSSTCGDCGECGSCTRQHECCLNPVKAVKAVLRFLGGSCACGGCDQEVYWGPYQRECDPCDRCGNHGSGPVSSYRSSSYVPQGEVIQSAPSGGCNCDKGRVSQSMSSRPTSSYVTTKPSGVRYETTATRLTSSYATTKSSGARSEANASRPRSSSQGSYASRSSADPYAPRLISVTDEVVRPAAPAARTAAAPLNLPVER